jgi:DNA invertase Pin-like site-specific DNA recombinase
MLGVFAEFETNLRSERQSAESMPPKRVASTRGRKPSIEEVEILRLCREEKLGPGAIARRLSISRASVYRLLNK